MKQGWPSHWRLGWVLRSIFRCKRLYLQRAGQAMAFGALVLLAGVLAAGYLRSDLEAPSASLLLRDRHGETLGELTEDAGGRHGFWPLGAVPPRIASATIAVEDRRFWSHPGVDLRAIVRAALQNIRSGRTVSGASTLAMQVARLQTPGSRSYGRKALEASTALWMVARHGRREVLAHYLRLVPYGNQAHGIGHAARRYFDKPVADLSWAETAFLAAIPQAPARMNPHDPRGRGRAVRRGLQILDLLRQDQLLSEVEYRLAQRQIARLGIPPKAQRPDEALHAVLRFEQRATEFRSERPIVDTTLDLALQREVSWLAGRAIEPWRARGAGNLAVMVVNLEDMSVRAALGSADFFDERFAGAIDYTQVARSSGSTLKPFFYAQALDRGLLEPTRVMDDLARGAGGIANSDGRFLGPLLPRFALGNSRNVPAAELLARLGLDEGWSLLAGLGLHDGHQTPERYGLGLTIGSLAVTPQSLAQAYGVLASDGRLRPLRWTRHDPTSEPVRVMSESAARLVTSFLADPQARLPSFPRSGHLELPFPAAVKTGTSSRYRDAWTVAYTPSWLVTVWVGDPGHQPMHGLSGYRSAARLAGQILRHLHPEAGNGVEIESFPAPRDYETVLTCAITGRAAVSACDRVVAEWRRHDQPRLDSCHAHQLLAVDRRSGHLASHTTDRQEIEIRSFLSLPPRYAVWQSAAGLPRPPLESDRIDTVSGTLESRASADALGRLARTSDPATLRVTSPKQDLHVFLDPETPAALSTLALSVIADPPPQQVLWKVDGRPYALTDYPFEQRWQLEPGDHTIQAEIPYTGIRSAVIRLRVE